MSIWQSLWTTPWVSPFRSPQGSSASWADTMLASYRTLNPEQAAWFDGAGSAVEAELLARLQEGEYLYTTFGPNGQNKSVCDFVYCWKTDGDIATRSITKSGDALRWDIDGTVTTQDDLPAHTLGSGDGILTVSSTDGWGGVTYFRINTNQFSGTVPNWDFPSVTNFLINTNQFSGTVPNWDFPSVVYFWIQSNQFSGAVPNWDFPSVVYFRISDNQFSGTVPNWDFPSVTEFWIYTNQFSGTVPNWDFPSVTEFFINSNQFSDFSSFLANLLANWSSKVGACDLKMQSNSATLSGSYADEDPPTTDLGHIYELVEDPESTGNPVYTITYDAP